MSMTTSEAEMIAEFDFPRVVFDARAASSPKGAGYVRRVGGTGCFWRVPYVARLRDQEWTFVPEGEVLVASQAEILERVDHRRPVHWVGWLVGAAGKVEIHGPALVRKLEGMPFDLPAKARWQESFGARQTRWVTMLLAIVFGVLLFLPGAFSWAALGVALTAILGLSAISFLQFKGSRRRANDHEVGCLRLTDLSAETRSHFPGIPRGIS